MLVGLGILSAAFFVASLVLVPFLIARLPADYFLTERVPLAARAHPAARLALLVFRAALGLLLVAAGSAMLVLPGQGLLTILAGLMVAEFPGKHRLESALLRQAAVVRVLFWLRRRLGRPPFRLPKG